MNLLAHLHLGQDLPAAAAAGNLTADFCKEKGSAVFQQGVVVHRRIDSFTDHHDTVADARRLFSGELRRFASVLVDLAFDICLSRTWSRWSDEPRHLFIDHQLGRLSAVAPELPRPAVHVLQAMVARRWMHDYDRLSGLEASVERIVRRRPRFRPMLNAGPAVEACYEDLEAIFLRFYPQLQAEIHGEPLKLDGEPSLP